VNQIVKYKGIMWFIILIIFVNIRGNLLFANDNNASTDSSILKNLSSSEEIHLLDFIEIWASWIIIGFQYFISDIDDHNCPMNPSCSRYGALAIKKHGFVIGCIMISDRLNRCSHDLYYYEKINKKGRLFNEDIP